MWNNVGPAIVHGLVTGGTYGAIALGLSLIFGVLRIINFAHGAMLMISCFFYYGLWTWFGINPYLGMIIVVPIMFLFGYLIRSTMIRRLFEREKAEVLEPVSVLLLTIGLWFALENLFLMIFGANFRSINTAISEVNIGTGNIIISLPRIIAFFGSIVITILLYIILNKTELGRKIRAVSQNRDAAALCGVNVNRMYNITFAMGVAVVSVAGSLLSQYYYVQPGIGSVFGTKSFMIVVLGGLGSIPGALLGGLIFGLVESVGAQFITSTSASMLSFMLFIIVLFLRPKGLLGKV
jgi:branched-chain amino acid transport system permease protein